MVQWCTCINKHLRERVQDILKRVMRDNKCKLSLCSHSPKYVLQFSENGINGSWNGFLRILNGSGPPTRCCTIANPDVFEGRIVLSERAGVFAKVTDDSTVAYKCSFQLHCDNNLLTSSGAVCQTLERTKTRLLRPVTVSLLLLSWTFRRPASWSLKPCCAIRRLSSRS
jgi:hypothetical protein